MPPGGTGRVSVLLPCRGDTSSRRWGREWSFPSTQLRLAMEKYMVCPLQDQILELIFGLRSLSAMAP
jgi:hypothetical protein